MLAFLIGVPVLPAGYSQAMVGLMIALFVSLAIGFTAEWIYKRPTLKRIATAGALFGLAMIGLYWPDWSGWSFWW